MTCPSCACAVPTARGSARPAARALAVTHAEERRIVTVLFADLVGFTALAEHRDPETVKRLIDALLPRLVDDVVAFGGRVDKILGDGDPGPVRRAGRPRGRRRAGRAGRAADAGDTGHCVEHVAGSPAAPASRCGSGSTPARCWSARSAGTRLHGDGRRGQHGVAPAEVGAARHGAGRRVDLRRSPSRRSATSATATSRPAVASRRCRPGSRSSRSPPRIAPPALPRAVGRPRRRARPAARRPALRGEPAQGVPRRHRRRGRRRQEPARRGGRRARPRRRGRARARGLLRALRRVERVVAARQRALDRPRPRPDDDRRRDPPATPRHGRPRSSIDRSTTPRWRGSPTASATS